MPSKLVVNEKTGLAAYEIAGYLMKTNKLENATEQFKCKIVEWLTAAMSRILF
jgi:hypothetical protein